MVVTPESLALIVEHVDEHDIVLRNGGVLRHIELVGHLQWAANRGAIAFEGDRGRGHAGRAFLLTATARGGGQSDDGADDNAQTTVHKQRFHKSIET